MSTKKTQILILDPEPRRLEGPETVLRSAGYDTLTLDSAIAACAILVRTPPELLILPLHVPAAPLLTQARTIGVPVMFALEDGTDEADVRRVYAMGGVDYITLPPVASRLLARTANQLRASEGKRAVAQAEQELYNFCMPVAHDLKAPFTAINMLLDVTKSRLGDDCTEHVRDVIDCVEFSSAGVKEKIETAYAKAMAHCAG